MPPAKRVEGQLRKTKAMRHLYKSGRVQRAPTLFKNGRVQRAPTLFKNGRVQRAPTLLRAATLLGSGLRNLNAQLRSHLQVFFAGL